MRLILYTTAKETTYCTHENLNLWITSTNNIDAVVKEIDKYNHGRRLSRKMIKMTSKIGYGANKRGLERFETFLKLAFATAIEQYDLVDMLAVRQLINDKTWLDYIEGIGEKENIGSMHQLLGSKQISADRSKKFQLTLYSVETQHITYLMLLYSYNLSKSEIGKELCHRNVDGERITMLSSCEIFSKSGKRGMERLERFKNMMQKFTRLRLLNYNTSCINRLCTWDNISDFAKGTYEFKKGCIERICLGQCI